MYENKLTAWQLINEFGPRDVACLIMGIAPHEANDNEIKPVLNRIRDDYNNAVHLHMQGMSDLRPGPDFSFDQNKTLETAIQSIAMIDKVQRSSWDPQFNSHDLFDWLVGKSQQPGEWNRSNFEEQNFSRNEIDRWLKINKISSLFSFNPEAQSNLNENSNQLTNNTRTPHRTTLMDIIDQASARFWGLNVRADDHDTHPKNSHVEDWLIREKQVKKTMASRIATIIRPVWAHKGKPIED